MLPEVTLARWEYKGINQKRGHDAHTWMLFQEPNEGYGVYHSNYTLYVTQVLPLGCGISW